jgi:hypothetical protein
MCLFLRVTKIKDLEKHGDRKLGVERNEGQRIKHLQQEMEILVLERKRFWCCLNTCSNTK